MDAAHSIPQGIMMRNLKLYSLLFILTLSLMLPTTFAQRTGSKPKTTAAAALLAARGVDTISAAQLRDYLYFIASDEMEGRDTPSRGMTFCRMSSARRLPAHWFTWVGAG